MTTRAKLVCVLVEPQYQNGQNGEKIAEQIKFETRYNNTDSAEDNSFSKHTPSANFSMSLTNGALFGNIVEGKAYYFDITEA